MTTAHQYDLPYLVEQWDDADSHGSRLRRFIMGHLPGRLLGTPIAPKAILVSARRLGTSSALTVNPISVARADRHWLIRSNSASGLLRGSYDGFWFSGGPFGCVLAPWGSVSDIMLRPTRNAAPAPIANIIAATRRRSRKITRPGR